MRIHSPKLSERKKEKREGEIRLFKIMWSLKAYLVAQSNVNGKLADTTSEQWKAKNKKRKSDRSKKTAKIRQTRKYRTVEKSVDEHSRTNKQQVKQHKKR